MLHNCLPQTSSTELTKRVVYDMSVNVFRLLGDENYAQGVIHYLKKRQLDLQNKEFKYVAYFNSSTFNALSNIVSGLKWVGVFYMGVFSGPYFNRDVDTTMIQALIEYTGLQRIISDNGFVYRLLENSFSSNVATCVLAFCCASTLCSFAVGLRRASYSDCFIPIEINAQDQTAEAIEQYEGSVQYIQNEIYSKNTKTMDDVSAGINLV